MTNHDDVMGSVRSRPTRLSFGLFFVKEYRVYIVALSVLIYYWESCNMMRNTSSKERSIAINMRKKKSSIYFRPRFAFVYISQKSSLDSGRVMLTTFLFKLQRNEDTDWLADSFKYCRVLLHLLYHTSRDNAILLHDQSIISLVQSSHFPGGGKIVPLCCTSYV